ncbi:MAG: DUF4032 domain-containing protein [Candidatus Eremiobacteraeota bacterium]|nr:DUF4032 domain-containing protein [Candidatus Eremiobacteraeota bacterium]
MSEHLYEFNEEYTRVKPEASYELGFVDVPLEEIVGTVGRYRDFDGTYLMSNIDSKRRLEDLIALYKKKGEFPPLDLYKIKDHYFILDGHHRLIAARQMGLEAVRARVVEFLPPRDSVENMLSREKSEFELATGLMDIHLTELSQYRKLKSQIREHKYYLSEKEKKEIPFRDAAKDWHAKVFSPLISRIEHEGILNDFHGRTCDDLYVYISDHKWMESQRRGYDIGFSTAIRDFHREDEEKTFSGLVKDLFAGFRVIPPRRKAFEKRTGLHSISLSKDHSYGALLKQIKEHKYLLSEKKGRELSLDEAALDWYYEIYYPIRHLIEEERHMSGFPRKTPGDLYLMLSELKWLESEKRGYDIGFPEALRQLRKEGLDLPGSRATIKKLLSTLKSLIEP